MTVISKCHNPVTALCNVRYFRAKDAVMADCNRVRDWLKHGKLTDAEGLKCATELISAGRSLDT